MLAGGSRVTLYGTNRAEMLGFSDAFGDSILGFRNDYDNRLRLYGGVNYSEDALA